MLFLANEDIEGLSMFLATGTTVSVSYWNTMLMAIYKKHGYSAIKKLCAIVNKEEMIKTIYGYNVVGLMNRNGKV